MERCAYCKETKPATELVAADSVSGRHPTFYVCRPPSECFRRRVLSINQHTIRAAA